MPLSFTLMVSGLLAEAGVSILIALVLLGLLRKYWRPYLRHWTRSWTALAVHAGGGAAAIILAKWLPVDHPLRFSLALIAGIAGYLQIAWLLVGTVELTRGTPVSPVVVRRITVWLTVLGAVLVMLYAWDPSRTELLFTLRVTVRRIAVGSAFILGGMLIRRAPRIARGVGRRTVMFSFFGLGGFHLLFVALSALPAPRARFGTYVTGLEFADVILYVALALGLVIWLLEEERQAAMDAAARIERIAYHDALTGLPNRQLFLNQMGMALHHARRHGTVVAVLFLDLDRFKIVNDSLGHAAGDLLIQTVAERIRSTIRAEDSVTRLGGDEFAVLAADARTAEDATMLAERIMAAVKRPIVIDQHEVFMTTSLGISLFPEDACDAEDLLKAADTAMYRAKSQGRDLAERYVMDAAEDAVRDQLGLEEQPPACARAEATRGALPANRAVLFRPDHRHGGAAPLESSHARAARPGRVHLASRGHRRDRADGGVGAQGGMRAGVGVAAAWTASAAGGGQPFRPAVAAR